MNTMQQEFDAVVTHLYKQGKPSKKQIGNNYTCAYRGDSGTMCAIGCRIPDSMYKKAMEGYNFCGIMDYELPEEITEYSDLFVMLQDCHDLCLQNANNTFKKSDLKQRLADTAKAFNLTYTVPKVAK